VKREEA